jgi:GT2 family glycosyltransferase
VNSTVRVIVVNFNAGDALVDCLKSVLSGTRPLRIVVVDNRSTDGSSDRARERLRGSGDVEFIDSPDNVGFARAVNVAAAASREDYLLVLNPDCVLAAGSLDRLCAAMDEAPRAGLAGPCVLSGSGRLAGQPEKSAYRRFPRPWTALMSLSGLSSLGGRFSALRGIDAPHPHDTVRAEAVSGACMLLRRECFEAVGGFDEGYAMHCEDLDLMYRLAQHGFECLYVPGAVVTHMGGLSSRSRPWWVHRQKHLGMQRFYRKFQAPDHSLPVRLLVQGGIWVHYVLTVPAVLVGR